LTAIAAGFEHRTLESVGPAELTAQNVSDFNSILSPIPPSSFAYLVLANSGAMNHRGAMNRRMPRPEDVSRYHIDATVVGFLQGDRDADWTEVSLVTLHPREEIRLVLKENADRYRRLDQARFLELLGRLRSQGVALRT